MKEKNVRGHYTFTHIAKENLLCKVLTINCERSHFPSLQDYRKFIERLTTLRCYLPRHMVLRIPFFSCCSGNAALIFLINDLNY